LELSKRAGVRYEGIFVPPGSGSVPGQNPCAFGNINSVRWARIVDLSISSIAKISNSQQKFTIRIRKKKGGGNPC
jgi:hypothetical protein